MTSAYFLFQGSTTRLIFAYGSTDPADNVLQSSDYHGGNRGAKSVYLLDPQSPTNSIPDDALHFDLLTNSVSVVLLLYSHKNSWQADLIHVTHAKIINKLVAL